MALETIVGRDKELAAIDSFLAAVEDGPRALLLEGEAGIGKTTLWSEAVRRADERGRTVLGSRPGQSETRLTFVGLADFLAHLDEGTLEAIPTPQRVALDVALMRATADRRSPDQRLISSAFLSVLRELARTRPVVLACDDLQWLDGPSYALLEFALRRLAAEPVLLLASLRLDADGAARRTLGGALAEDRVRRLRLESLSLSAVHQMIAAQLERPLPRPTLVRIEEASGGNPLFALELARAVAESGTTTFGARPLPVPADLRALIERRVARLPPETRATLLVAAALSRPRIGALDSEALNAAERAGLVRVEPDGAVSFAHPLYAAAVYASAAAVDRRAAHRQLAEATDDVEGRARHLALAADSADPEVARVLDEASTSAARRGAPAAAADLAELALELTPRSERDDALRRTVVLADALFRSGDAQRSRLVLEDALRDAPAGRLRCEALSSLARALWLSADWREAIPCCEQALAEATDRDIAARMHAQLASMGDLDLQWAAGHARAAVGLLNESDDPIAYGFALLSAAQWEFFAGGALNDVEVERGLGLIKHAAPAEAGTQPAGWARVTDDFQTARTRYERLVEQAADFGDEPSLCTALAHLATLECWLGNLAAAREHAERSLDLAELIGQQSSRCMALHACATAAVYRGDADAARAYAACVFELLRLESDPIFELMTESVLGSLDLAFEAYPQAAAHLARASELLASMGWREPAPFRFQADEVEAAVALGELDRAREVTAALQERARVNPRPWVRAMAARCRGLILAAEGELASAKRELDAALVEHEALDMPLERARSLLVLGQIERRRKEKLLAQQTFGRALEIFLQIGAEVWAQRVRAELERVGLRRREPGALTASEERVVRLAASGLTNREIAERAFMSPKTVEANLARAYRKLGIRSRAELGRLVAERERADQT